MSKDDLDISAVLLRITSLTLKCVPEETRAPHSLPLTSLPVVQTVCDLKGRSLGGEAKALHLITSR